jgi:hypothetical protein
MDESIESSRRAATLIDRDESSRDTESISLRASRTIRTKAVIEIVVLEIVLSKATEVSATMRKSIVNTIGIK